MLLKGVPECAQIEVFCGRSGWGERSPGAPIQACFLGERCDAEVVIDSSGEFEFVSEGENEVLNRIIPTNTKLLCVAIIE